MTIKERINEDLKNALKSGNADTAAALRFLNSAIKNKELEKRTKLAKEDKAVGELQKLSELNDDEVATVVLSEIKKRKESVEQYQKGGREDLAKKELLEIKILKKYAPEEISEEELRVLVKKKIGEMGEVSAKDFGKLIGAIMAEVKNRASGDVVKRMIGEELKK